MQNDVDMARYSLQQSENFFIKKWQQIIQGNNSLLSSDLKHIHLENLQRNHELNEFIQLYSKPEVSQHDIMNLFTQWKIRAPSAKYDQIVAWDMVILTRLICAKLLSESLGL
jgi:FAT domain